MDSASGSRCKHAKLNVRCKLRDGHHSAHAARHGDTLVHWPNEQFGGGASHRVALDWWDQ